MWKRIFTILPAPNYFLVKDVESRLSIATPEREEKLKINESVCYRKCLLLGSRDLNCLFSCIDVLEQDRIHCSDACRVCVICWVIWYIYGVFENNFYVKFISLKEIRQYACWAFSHQVNGRIVFYSLQCRTLKDYMVFCMPGGAGSLPE